MRSLRHIITSNNERAASRPIDPSIARRVAEREQRIAEQERLTIERELADCVLIGPDAGAILRALVYGTAA